MPAEYRKSARTTLKRRPERAAYDHDSVHAILDQETFCHIAYVADGQPRVLPTLYWREGSRVWWHGSRASQALRAMAGAQVCFSVSRLDGWVLARSAFHHSVNYRAVMAYGQARWVEDEEQKREALQRMFDRLYPGRWSKIRQPSASELAAVAVLWLELDEVSAKSRALPPLDSAEDLAIPVWAGVAPLQVSAAPLQPCAKLGPSAGPPEGLEGWAAGEAAPIG